MTGLDLAPWVAGLGALILAAWRLVRFGENRAKARADRAALNTIERIEDAKEHAAAGGAGWHDRLHATRK